MQKLNYSLISNIEFKGINHRDYPDYCDAYIVSAEYDGKEMTQEQIEMIDGDFFYEKLIEQIF
jgi:hypothetical protein